MILSHTLINPIVYKIQDPFFSIIDEIEHWLTEYQPNYKETKWSVIKYEYLKRLLGLAKNGSYLRGQVRHAPTEELETLLLDIYHLLDHCVYFTSQYWRAFFYYLKTGKLNPCWPQFSQREADLACSLLSEDDLTKLRIEADKEWTDFFSDSTLMTTLFKKIRRPIYRLCYKRVSFLQEYDPSLYSLADVQQYAMESILVSIRNNDYLNKSMDWLIGWSLKCADNAIHNLIGVATAKKRSKIIEDDDAGSNQFSQFGYAFYKHREYYLSLPLQGNKNLYEDDIEFPLIDSILVLGNQPFANTTDLEDKICLKELIKIADPKIGSYLRTICGGEHNPDFWAWFYYNEPTLVQRIAYIEENPGALGPYLQRHLNLPTYQLTSFLRQHLPDLLEKVSNTSSNQAMLAYA